MSQDDSGPLSPLARTGTQNREAQFRQQRVNRLIEVNLHTFWWIAVILPAFGLWDLFVDPLHWRAAFAVRGIGSIIVIATGLFQQRPGQSRWMPLMAKLRMAIAVSASVTAAAMLDRGFGFGAAGVVVIILTGPYTAIDSRDLLRTNLLMLAALIGVMVAVPLDSFDRIGIVVFALLAAAVSTLLGRLLEASHRRGFALDLELHHDARTDTLTGLANRRAMDERGPIELKRAKRAGSRVSVVLCDLDHFKSINDRYGHEVGDAALGQTAAVLLGALRQTDALARWGGEEFIAVLPDTGARGAAEVAERMRSAIAATTFHGFSGSATISLGVATSQGLDEPALEWDLLMKEADQRLYRAKHEGRNRVVAEPD